MNNPRIRDTKARRVMVEELCKVESHPTADELYEMVRKRIPRVSLGTIYRNLEILAENGVIMKLDVAGTQRRYDGTIKNHYHFRCLECGRIRDIPVEPIKDLERILPKDGDCVILGHRLELHGLCPSCKSTVRGRSDVAHPSKTDSLTSLRKEKEEWI